MHGPSIRDANFNTNGAEDCMAVYTIYLGMNFFLLAEIPQLGSHDSPSWGPSYVYIENPMEPNSAPNCHIGPI